ncbi:MAG: DNA-binding protein WhiA [Eubacterium sp.]|nr:DNA-binding protein WhiA [Eubacterium sp.]
MSFTSEVKRELADRISNAKHCRVAEIAALISMCGNVEIDEFDQYKVYIQTDTELTAKKFRELLWKTFHIDTDVEERDNQLSHSKKTYIVEIKNSEDALSVLESTKIMNNKKEIEEQMDINKNEILKKDCCKRAYLRGAFLASGSISDPEKSYHFEIKCINKNKANQIVDILKFFGVDAKTLDRKSKIIVYLKDSEKVVDALNIMEAPIALLKVETVKVDKEMMNKVNRQMNCDMANNNRTITAAQRVLADIKYIDEEVGLSYLPEKLQEVARIRMENPEESLQDIGDMMNPPLGKSGVNHRLRKISEIANNLREEGGSK